MTDPAPRLLHALARRGWTVRRSAVPRPLLPAAVASRYSDLPPSLTAFLAGLDLCRSPDDTAWFLTADDYARVEGPGFRWNELELMALEACEDDADAQREIAAFWDRHFPFLLAVHSDYDYLAVRIADGAIVHGFAPEWEDPSPIALSFSDFALDFARAASGNRTPETVIKIKAKPTGRLKHWALF